jgi:parvulin-like peptidyl-prolyl isomerase
MILTRLAPAQGAAPGRGAPAAKPAADPAIATVGGVSIGRTEFERRFHDAEDTYRTRSSAPLPVEIRPLFRRQILETLIRERLIVLEARRRGLSLNADQAEEELKKDPLFTRNGSFDEARFLAIKSSQPEQFRQAVAQLQANYGALKVKEDLDRQCAPDEAQLRAKFERELSKASLDFLPLVRADFERGTPQPTEAEVLAYYHTHGEEFRHASETGLVLLLVNRPAPATNADQSARQAWEAQMRQRADSLLAVARHGRSLEDLAAFGELRQATVSPGHFPSYWIGNPRSRDAALAAAPGTVLSEVVRAERGWMIVRVDERTPTRTARLGEVADQIRDMIRARQADESDAAGQRRIYSALRDSLRGPAYQLRYAFADTSRFHVAEPTASDLDRYYRGHLVDYTQFDPTTSTVKARPFAEVRDDVRRRLTRERRESAARAAAAQLLAVWRQGRRDPKVERAMTGMREVGPLVDGAVVDTGAVGAMLTDSLSLSAGPAIGMLEGSTGWVVYHVYAQIKDYVPTLEQVRPLLMQRQAAQQAADEERAARDLFAHHPERFRTGDVVKFSRLMVESPEPTLVTLSREEVQTWYDSHLADYGAPELVRVRHILAAPHDASPEADREARARAEGILARIRSGESFLHLAQQLSDDEATRESGGDVGVFRRGMMLPAFEEAAFTMSVGELRGPVKTEAGYHILECLEHVPAEVVPLKYAYANVGQDAAREKGRRIAHFRADSLFRTLKTVAAARAAAHRLGYEIYQDDHTIGDPIQVADLRPLFLGIEKLHPRQFYDQIQEYRGMGFAITWCDTVLPPRTATWEEAHERVIEASRRETARGRMLAKQAELDSLLRAGWTLDSLAELRGGLRHLILDGPGVGLSGLGGAAIVDSLVIGAPGKGPALRPGQFTEWVEFPGGLARVRLLEKKPADPVALANRIESSKRVTLELNLRNAFDRLKQRFPVRILDHDLEITELPALTENPS